ncbi:MAG: error-prone DNA polymerase [Steroidobacteraceae bacterium]|nr:error-prone DNA polymerase [Steroidobacteraceae bacterium]
MAPPPAYAELHCLSNFTFLRGASHPAELVQRAHALGYSALALTDECSVAGVVRAHVAAKAVGLPLIVGSEFALDDGLRLVLLAADRAGYGELVGLVTRARRAAPKGRYRLSRADLEGAPLGHCEALWLPPPTRPGAADPALAADGRWFRERFGRRGWLAVELPTTGYDRERLATLIALGVACALPCVAGGDVHMHVRERRRLQDVLTAIRLGVPISAAGYALHPNGERHLRTRARLARLYPPDLLRATLAVAERCTFSLDVLRYEYPDELVPEGHTPTSWLRELSLQGLRDRWPDGPPAQAVALVERELALIAELGYEPFFLTVHDVVAFARSRGILCQGRGSAANSAVCYALRITEVDPSRMQMLFERFVSKERNEPPDIDVDFEHERREEVIQYLYAKYGRHRAALAATVITYHPRSAIRDVGRALGLDGLQVERMARAIQWWDGSTVADARIREAGLDPLSPVVARCLERVRELIGFPRHLSQHVGGFVIARRDLAELVPVENAAMADRTVIQWDKDDLDDLGLLKVDVLALGMLTAIRRALDLASHWRGVPLTIDRIPPEDRATYEMISRADTVGVFQIESRAQMAMLPRLKPRNYYDLVIEVAIVRPGPIQGDMVHPYLRRRIGLEPVTYPSEEVRGVLERTLGVPIFQEQVMQLAIVAAGFTPGEADQLRRAMAAWKRKGGLGPFEQRLIEGMRARGYPDEFARALFTQILGFGEYGFPESHSASFALLVYVSAWLKRHEPAAFAAALLNSQPMGFYAPAQLVRDAREHGVDVRPPDVRASDWDCTLEAPVSTAASATTPTSGAASTVAPAPASTGASSPTALPGHAAARPPANEPGPALRLGLRLVRGLPESAGRRIVAARAARAFGSVQDLAERATLDRRELGALAAAGALVGLAGHRHRAAWEVAGVLEPTPLFAAPRVAEGAPLLAAPHEGQDVVADYRSLGLTLGRHPLALLRGRLDDHGIATAARLHGLPHGTRARGAGLVLVRQRPGSASGVTFVTLEDETGVLNLVVWKRVAERWRRALLDSRLLEAVGTVQREGDVLHLVVNRLVDRSAWLGELDARSRDFH